MRRILIISILCLAGFGVWSHSTSSRKRIPSAHGPGVLAGAVPDQDGLLSDETEVRRLEASARRSGGTPEGVHRLGLVRLARDESEAAISLLRRAASLEGKAAVWNDLSVAYLASFDQGGDFRELLRAHMAARRALEADPTLIEARFNLAVSLTLLHLRRSADLAWRSVDWRTGGDRWRAAVETWQANLKSAALEDLWPSRRQMALDGVLPPSALADLARQFPFRSRLLIEQELLPRWAAEHERGDLRAAESLRIAALLAAEIARLDRDHLAADSVKVVEHAVRGDQGSRSSELSKGLRMYGKGVAAFENGDTVNAESLLGEAAEALDAANCPLAGWARLYAALCRYYEDADEAYQDLLALSEDTPTRRYPALAGRIQWALGTIDVVQYRAQVGLSRYRQARELLERGSGPAQAAFVDVLMADTLAMLGLHDEAWGHWSRALDWVPRVCVQRRWEALWSALAFDLLRQGRAELALPFLDELVRLTENHPDPSARAQPYIDRAEAYARIEPARAEVDIEAANEIVDTMAEGPLKDTMRHQLLVAAGWNARERQPHRALAALEEAERLGEARGYRFDELRVWTALGSVHRALDQPEVARQWLMRAVERYERQRLEIPTARDRRELLRRAQPAYDQLLAIYLEGRRPIGDLFGIAERARARAQSDEFGEHVAEPLRIPDLSELIEAFTAGRVLVYYVLTSESVLAIVIEEGMPRLVRLPVAPADLHVDIEGFRAELESHAPDSWLESRSADLFDRLIGPLALSDSHDEIVFIPDRSLQRVPFGALRDADGRYLIDVRPVSTAPSASLWLATGRQDPAAGADGMGPVLAIAGASGPVAGYPLLGRLRFVGPEVETVAGLYPGGRIARTSELATTALGPLIAQAEVVHFAGHAVIYPDNIEASMLLSAEASGGGFRPPEQAGLRLDAFRRNLPDSVHLFVLSACSTSDTLGLEREAVYGFAGMLQALGVRNVVATLWDIDDEAAFRISVAFHQAYSKGRRAPEALRGALLASRDSVSFSDWAAFVALGSYTGKNVLLQP